MTPAPDGPAPALLCLPHAGASIAKFRPWVSALAPQWEVVPLELPGRGARYSEPLATDLTEAVDSLLPLVTPRARRPWVLLGHSLGAVLAFELAQAAARLDRSPSMLITSGRNGPTLPQELPPLHGLDDRALLTGLRSYGGMPADEEVPDELLEVFLPILRADLRLAEQYRRPGHHPPLTCPVVSFVAQDDRLCRPERVATWRRETVAWARVVEHPGDHFALYEPRFVSTLRGVLASALNADADAERGLG